jgi:hypothetical protein
MSDAEKVTVKPEWISVEDRLPEDDRIVIGYNPQEGFIGEVCYSRKEFSHLHGYFPIPVTHWMPMPDPPSAP